MTAFPESGDKTLAWNRSNQSPTFLTTVRRNSADNQWGNGNNHTGILRSCWRTASDFCAQIKSLNQIVILQFRKTKQKVSPLLFYLCIEEDRHSMIHFQGTFVFRILPICNWHRNCTERMKTNKLCFRADWRSRAPSLQAIRNRRLNKVGNVLKVQCFD